MKGDFVSLFKHDRAELVVRATHCFTDTHAGEGTEEMRGAAILARGQQL